MTNHQAELKVRSWRLTAASITIATFFCGCSGRVATYPVSGTVRFDDGQPVRIGVVEFRCQESGLCARAKLDDTGSFSLGTFANTDGAPAGAYKIVVVQYFDALPRNRVHTHTEHDASDHDADEHDAHDPRHLEPDARVAAKFSDYSTSPLTATVSPDAENKFDFVATHPKQPPLINPSRPAQSGGPP